MKEPLPCPFCANFKRISSEVTEVYMYPLIQLKFRFWEHCPMCKHVFHEMKEDIELNIIEEFTNFYLEKFKEELGEGVRTVFKSY